MPEAERLKYIGDLLFEPETYLTNVEYFEDSYNTLGELDIYGFIDDVLCIVEYKSNDVERRREKAMRQLNRAKKYAIPTGQPYMLIYAYQKSTEAIEFSYPEDFDKIAKKWPKAEAANIPEVYV